ncbi:MAG: HAMP domain-containing sensor histidine kinase [Gammaproteobacteria bacterium]
MSTGLAGGGAERRLRWALLVFFLALALPAALLAWHAWGQVRWQVLHQYRTLAEELAARVDGALSAAIAQEDARGFADYAFLVVDSAAGGGLALSPLARAGAGAGARLPGLVGYFQVDSAGRYSSPLVPPPGTAAQAYGIDAAELARRRAADARLRAILGSPDASLARRDARAAGATAEAPAGAAANGTETPAEAYADASAPRGQGGTNVFERLTATQQAYQRGDAATQRSADLERAAGLREKSRAEIAPAAAPPRTPRREQVVMLAAPDAERAAARALPPRNYVLHPPLSLSAEDAGPAPAHDSPSASPLATAGTAGAVASMPRIRLFESELDPFVFQRLDAAHFVLFRNVWREGERYVQGAVIELAPFLAGAVLKAFRDSLLARMTELAVAFQGEVLARDRARPVTRAGELLYRARLSAPLADLELVFGVVELPLGASAAWLGWLTVALLLVLTAGCYAIDRFARGYLRLARQQQDFVAAVSHELKTPLTAIRMYSEMLEAGWADEQKKAGWYTYIRVEAERLSRLIANVLTLARMNRGQAALELRETALGALLERVGTRLASPVAAAGFVLDVDVEPAAASATVAVDEDALTQVLLNLVDNAIKFTPAAAPRRIVLAARRGGGARVTVSVRDHGAGVPRAERRRIFDLFYRSGDAARREQPGTGIGLALVRELTAAMHGTVSVADAAPGAVFTITLPRAGAAGD